MENVNEVGLENCSVTDYSEFIDFSAVTNPTFSCCSSTKSAVVQRQNVQDQCRSLSLIDWSFGQDVGVKRNNLHSRILSDMFSNHPKTMEVKATASVARRNARERKRIKNVNQAFDDLRKRVPTGDSGGKISKVETLRSAIEYIRALQILLNDRNSDEDERPCCETRKHTNVSSTTISHDENST